MEQEIGSKSPLFSVIIMSFRHDDYFKDAIESVLSQDFDREKYEIIAVIKSTGKARHILDRIRKDHVISIVEDDDFPQGKKLSLALERCHGEWISIIEDDDIWVKYKLSKIKEVIDRSSSKIVYIHNSSYVIIGDEKERLYYQPEYRTAPLAYKLNLDNFSFKDMQSACDHNASSITVKKEIALSSNKLLKKMEGGIDTFLFSNSLISGGDLYCVHEKLTLFRVSSSNPYPTELAHNLERQLTGLFVIQELARETHNVDFISLIDSRIAENKIKLRLLNHNEGGGYRPQNLYKNYVSCPSNRNFQGFVLISLLAVSFLSRKIALRLYLRAIRGKWGTLETIKSRPARTKTSI